MNRLKINCFVKNMQDRVKDWKIETLVLESDTICKEEKILKESKTLIETSEMNTRTKRKYQKRLSASYYISLMEKGYSYEEIYTLLKKEFNKYYDRPNCSAIVESIFLELEALKLAINKLDDNTAIDLYTFISTEVIFRENNDQLIKARTL